MQTNAKKRFPYVSWEQVMAFDPQKPETATPSVVVNAFLEAVPFVRPCDLKYIGLYLGLPSAALSGALYCATGLSFAKFLDKWRLDKLAQIKAENPKLKGDHLAQMLGFYDRSALWLFMKRKHLKKQKAGRDPEDDVAYWMKVLGEGDEEIESFIQKYGRK